MTIARWLYVYWAALLFPATIVFASLYDPTNPNAVLPFSFVPARFAAMIFSWPMALVVAPMVVGFVIARRAWARSGAFSPTDKMAMVWFLMSATWFHIGCDVLSGLFQLMPNMTDAYRAMNAANWQPLHHPDRIVLDVVYWFELFVQMPLAYLTFWLYAIRSPARPGVECFLCGLHVTGTVAYYVPDVVLGETTHSLLTNMDRVMASLWIWVPAALALRATRAMAARRGASPRSLAEKESEYPSSSPTEDRSMAILDRYLAYADAFEQSYVDDDWTRLETYFTPGAVYDGAPAARGRDAVLAKLKGGVDAFDRRMDSRTPDFATPTVSGNTLQMKWKVTYTKKGVPDLVISGVEIAEFDGDRIALLRDVFDPAAEKAMGEWMAKHGKALQPG